MLTTISLIIEESDAKYYFFGGDINVFLSNNNSSHASAINASLDTYKIKTVNIRHSTNNNDIAYTYSNHKLNHYSLIDYICISDCLIDSLVSYNILDNAINHSDHMPVAAVINMPSQSKFCSAVTGVPVQATDVNNTSNKRFLRWDRTNLKFYYSMSGDLLYPIYESVVNILSSNECLSNVQIEQHYSATVHALLTASDQCVSYIPQKSLKHWWNSELSTLKSNSCCSHKIWLEAGKPLNGFLIEQKNKDKLLYKLAIKRQKNAAKNVVSDKLQ